MRIHMDTINANNIEVFSFTTDRIELKSEDGNDYVIGYVSTSDRDIVDDVVTKSCLMDMLDQLKGGRLKLDMEHETLRGTDDFDRKLNIAKVPLAVSVDGAYDSKGLMVKYKMNDHYKKLDSKGDVVYTYPEVKDMIKDESLDAFSIAFVTERETTRKANDGVNERQLDKIKWINTALTGNPINERAGMVNVMLKSLDRDHDNQKGSTESDMLKGGKPMDKKSYPKDGLHVHTKEDPQGEHTHPEIESAIDGVYRRISDIQTESDGYKGGHNMTKDEKENLEVKDKATKKADEESEKQPEKKPEPSSEDKSNDIEKSVKDLKSIVEKQIEALEKANEQIEGLRAELDKPRYTNKAEDAGATKAAMEAKSLKERDVTSWIA